MITDVTTEAGEIIRLQIIVFFTSEFQVFSNETDETTY